MARISLTKPLGPRARLLVAAATLAVGVAGSALADSQTIATARADWQAGRLVAAASALKDLLQKEPSQGDARALLARVCLDANDAAAAEKEAAEALKQGVAPDTVLDALGRALIGQRKFDRALAVLDPQDDQPAALRAELLALRGDAYQGRDDAQAAGLEYANALEVNANNTRALLGQARFAAARGDLDAARQILTRAGTTGSDPGAAWLALGALEYGHQRYAEAESAYDQAIAQSSDRWQAHLRRAEARLGLGNLDGARDDVNSARALNATSAELGYVEGLIAFQAADYGKAKELLTTYLSTQPTQTRALYSLGAIAYQLGEYQQVDEYLGPYLKADPNALMAVKVLAAARIARGSFTSAEELLAPWAAQEHKDPEVLDLHARALLGLGQRAAAVAELREAAQTLGDNGQSARQLAQTMMQAGEYAQAQKVLRGVLAAESPPLQARLLLIDAYLADGKAPDALKEAQAAAAQAPGDPRPAAAQGLAQLAAKQPDAAADAFKKALSLQPGFPIAALSLGRMAAGAGDAAGARRYFEQALAAEPANTQAILLLAELDAADGSRLAALARLSAGLAANPSNVTLRVALAQSLLTDQRPAEALHMITEAPQGGARDPGLLLVHAQAALASGQPHTALDRLRGLVAAQPRLAAAHLLMAQAALASGDTATMVEETAVGFELDPRHPMGKPTVAQVLARLTDPAASTALMARLKAAAPRDMDLNLLEARALGESGDQVGELKLLAEIHRSSPTNQDAYRALVQNQIKQGDLFEATRALKEWLAQHPKDAESMTVLADVYRRRSQPDKERETYLAILAQQPDNISVLNNLAWLLRTDDPAAALRYAHKAYDLDTKNAAVADTLGVLLLAKGEYARAVELLSGAHAAMPAEPSITFHLASALVAAGDTGAAKPILAEIVNQSFPEREEAQALYRKLAN